MGYKTTVSSVGVLPIFCLDTDCSYTGKESRLPVQFACPVLPFIFDPGLQS